MSTGHLHLDGFDSLPIPNKKRGAKAPLFYLEQGTGIEPASEAWEATIIADILTLRCVGIIAEGERKFNLFLSYPFSANVTFPAKNPLYRVREVIADLYRQETF